jgi:hypothetical protein
MLQRTSARVRCAIERSRGGENLRDSQEDTGSASQSAQQVTGDGQSADTGTTKGGSGRNHPFQLLIHALLAMPCHDQPLILQLFGDIPRSGAGNLDPRLGEDGTGHHDEENVDGGVDGVEERVGEVQGRRHVVCKPGCGVELGRALSGFPHPEQLHQQVVGEARIERLADEEDVGGQGRLQHDGHVGRVEQAHGIGATHSTLTGGLDGDLYAESLKVDDRGEDGHGGKQVHDVGEVLSIEGLVERALLVGPGQKEVEQRDDGALELGTTTSVDGGWRKGFPDDGFADVGCDEERDTASQSISFL